MWDDDLRSADDLEAQIRAGQPDRHAARTRIVGRLVASGKLSLHVQDMQAARKKANQEPDAKKRKSDAKILDRENLVLHGYRFKGGEITGPSSAPGGDPGEAPEQHEGVSPSPGAAGESGSGGGGGGTVSRSDARRRIQLTRDYADWRTQIRGFDIWTACQERRAWLFGGVVVMAHLEQPGRREEVRRRVAEGGDAEEIELWSEDDIRADYSAQQLGEG